MWFYIQSMQDISPFSSKLRFMHLFLDLAVAKSLQSTRTVTDDADDDDDDDV